MRGINPVLRFLFLTFLAKEYGSSFLGEFSLFVTSATLMLYFIGFDYYNFSIREFIQEDNVETRNKIVTNQFIFHIMSYGVFFIIAPLFFIFNFIESKYIFFFISIVIVDHLSQEMYRLLIADKEPIYGSLLLFLRSSVWIIILMFLYFVNVKFSLNNIFLFWFFLSLFSVIIGTYKISSKYNLRFSYFDYKWIKKGILVSCVFFTGTMATKIIEFSNRYIIDYYMTKSELGVFSFFSSIANQVNMIVDSIIIVALFPVLVKKINENVQDGLAVYSLFFKKVLLLVIISSIVIGIFANPLITIIGKAEFSDSIFILYLLLIGQIFYVSSFVPHFLLFALKKDVDILKIIVLSAFVGFIFNVFFIKFFGLIGAGVGTIFSGLILFCLKFFTAKYFVNKNRLLINQQNN